MMQPLEGIFGELGIAQYLDAFLDQGFDTWDTILDITESDLDALGVKLGHRRKLQRRIANSRGLGPQILLASPTRASVEDVRKDGIRSEAPPKEQPALITKRKYRRHPKPDENAPERPPSAYVLFSNKMREDLKGRNLTFTEIAKLVGENWQNLSPLEKEPYESQAQAAKERFNADLSNYKKTPEYKLYSEYLQEFKLKYSHQSLEKDVSKRVRLSEAGTSTQSSSSANATPERTTRSASGSEAPMVSEPPLPLDRKKRVGSTVSMNDGHQFAPGTLSSFHPSADDSVPSTLPSSMHSPRNSIDRFLERSPSFSTSPQDLSTRPSRRSSTWTDDKPPSQRSLPSLSDLLDHRALPNGGLPSDANGFPYHRGPLTESPGPMATLQHEHSSAGSTSSGSSYGFPRTPTDASLPIHALLGSSKPTHPFDPIQRPQAFRGDPVPVEYKPVYSTPHVNGASLSPLANGYQHHQMPPLANGPMDPSYTVPYGSPSSVSTAAVPGAARPETGFDGMSALLKAGELVDRRAP